jgi:AcrR family transcriptional regulator
MVTSSQRLPSDERKAHIVAAVLDLACQRRPSEITTSAVADHIGLTQGALFKHFPTKDSMWEAVISWVHLTLITALEHIASQAPTPLEALASIFRTHVAFVQSHPGAPRVMFHELERPADTAAKKQIRALMQRYHQLLGSVLNEAIKQGQLPKTLDVEAASVLFVGMIQGLVMQSMMRASMDGMQARADRVLAIYLQGLRAQP